MSCQPSAQLPFRKALGGFFFWILFSAAPAWYCSIKSFLLQSSYIKFSPILLSCSQIHLHNFFPRFYCFGKNIGKRWLTTWATVPSYNGELLMTQIQSYDGLPPFGHMTVLQVLSNRDTFMAVCSIPQSGSSLLWWFYFCRKLVFISKFQQNSADCFTTVTNSNHNRQVPLQF